MLTATNDYKGIVASTSRMWRGQLLDSNNTPLSCDIMGVEVHKGTRGRDYQIGTMFAPHFSGTIRNYTGTLMGETLQFQLGLDISGVTEWVTICTGTVYQVTENGDDLSFTAAGVLATAGDLIVTEQGTDITDIITDIETLTGVTVSAVGAASTIGLTGTLAQSMDGLDVRTALQYLAGVFGGFVSEGADGGIVIGNIYSGTQVQVTDDEIQKLPDSSGSFDITGFEVVVTAGGVDASGTVIPDVSYTDGTVVLTSVNPYMTSTLFNSVKSYVTGLTVYAGAIEQTMGNPLVEPWDIVYNDAYSDLRGSEIVITYNGGVSCRITSELTTTEEVATVQTGPMSAQISKIEDKLYTIQDGLNYFWVDSSGAHVTQVPKDQFLASPQGGNTLIDSNGLQVRDGTTTLASFANTGARIGQTGETHAEVDYHSLQLIDREGSPFFYASDLRDQNGELQWTDKWDADGGNSYHLTLEAIDTNYPVYVDGNLVTTGITKYIGDFVFTQNIPDPPSVISSTYTSSDQKAKAFTLGLRMGSVAPLSVAEGYQTTASGVYSHAEGFFTEATEHSAHAEGQGTIASEALSHAEGDYTVASGYASHAQNDRTIAGYYAQTAIGHYNKNTSTNLFEIGNGTSSNARSNAFEVADTGNVTAAGTLTTGGQIKSGGRVILPNNTGLRFLNSSNTEVTVGYMSTGDGVYFGNTGNNLILLGSNGNSSGTILNSSGNLVLNGSVTVNRHASAIGYTNYAEASTGWNLTQNANTQLASTTLSIGTWEVVATARFTGGASSGNGGVKALGILTGTSSLSTATPGHMRMQVSANYTVVLVATRILSITADNTTVTLQATSTQTTPGSVAWYSWRWVRIA